MSEIIKKYSNEDITIVWKPTSCIHSTKCWKGESGLKQVFNPMEKPWIKPTGAATHEIIERIKNCPSGALSFYHNDPIHNETQQPTLQEQLVEVLPNGPLLVHGNLQVKHNDLQTSLTNKVTAFCRCGASANKPYCDGTHSKTGFTG